MNIASLGLVALLATAAVPAATAAAAPECAVTDGSISWGFKETFRSYISGSIANGQWTVADGATYQTPNFGWADGVGNVSEGVGTLDFTGSIEFTGHGDILDTTVANPSIVFDGSTTALLLLDVSGTTQQGAAIDTKAVEFATIDLSDAVYGEGRVIVTDAPTVLTEPGAVAFGTYEAGEPLDPITVDFSVDSSCATEPVGGPNEAVLWAGAVALVAALGIVLIAVMRRRPEL